ncbi:hypothetical protein BV22DRAFT_1125091 [Leucogyrophana mollusca]|uniref:Uncharacterized protein n=1 Tax=Leucogyrophana mollusca TaxID=85980 RepID=A0ACB8BXZ5_9AGAM|nr:hypothetical protein BV22DRAFT_1125091 [Leucogyrophana mollusca]
MSFGPSQIIFKASTFGAVGSSRSGPTSGKIIAPTRTTPFTSLTTNVSGVPSRKPSSTISKVTRNTSRAAPVALTEEVTPSSDIPPPYDIIDVKAAQVELKYLHDTESENFDLSREHELQTAPILTREAYVAAEYEDHTTQYGVIGSALSIHSRANIYIPADPRLYINTNAPFSAVVCGVQGSGKSHTVSVLLENMFIPNQPTIGSLEKPLSGLVLHFGEGGPNSRPSETAWVGVASKPGITAPTVRVFVSKSSLNTMKAVYAPLGARVTVEPLLFKEEELDAQAFLSMMAVGSSESAPLYIQISVLRELGENFSYERFIDRLEDQKRSFNPAQLAGLEQRMALLNSFMEFRPYGRRMQPQRTAPRFAAGQLTIIDLSDPFIDSPSACGLFEIVTRLFVRAEVGTGKVLVVDEAHKYLSQNRSVAGLTKALLTLTREQRHLAMRVIISTQEPTVIPPVLLDLCTVSILHRFSSPSWWDHLARHVSADISADDAFDNIVKLQTGEAIMLAPSGLGVFPEDLRATSRTIAPNSKGALKLSQFGRRYILMKTRVRVTKDGGASILVVGPSK